MTDLTFQDFDSRLVGRAIGKALLLWAVFYGMYAIIQPVQNDRLPTIHNTLVPGRLRFEARYEFFLERMIDDHEIHAARAEAYNIVMLGSSEMWGNRTQGIDAIPAFVNDLAMPAADGRAVRVYNAAFPFPDAMKDLLIAQALAEQDIPIDLMILAVNFESFAPKEAHRLYTSNPAFVQHVLTLYDLQPYFPVPSYEAGSFWADRFVLASWLNDQVLAVRWLTTQRDRDFLIPGTLTEMSDLDTLSVTTLPDVLAAFGQFRQQTGIPLMILAVPAPFERNVFSDWIQQQTQVVHLPLIDCTHVFTQPAEFQDELHIMPEMHPVFAQIIGQQLSDPELADTAEGLPLHLPSVTETNEGLCTVYAAS